MNWCTQTAVHRSIVVDLEIALTCGMKDVCSAAQGCEHVYGVSRKPRSLDVHAASVFDDDDGGGTPQKAAFP